MKLFEDNVSEPLAIKAKASMLEGEVLFTIKEIRELLKAIDDSEKYSYDRANRQILGKTFCRPHYR